MYDAHLLSDLGSEELNHLNVREGFTGILIAPSYPQDMNGKSLEVIGLSSFLK
jgi:hypothetical protein